MRIVEPKRAKQHAISPPSRIGPAQNAETAPALQQAHMPQGPHPEHVLLLRSLSLPLVALREFSAAERIDEIEIPNQFSLPLPPTEARAWNLADSSNPYQHEIASV